MNISLVSFLLATSFLVDSTASKTAADVESEKMEFSISNSNEALEEEDRELQVSFDDPNDYFNFYSDADDWARCNIATPEDGCLPIVSIEEAACRAKLIVWGRIIDENSAGDRKIGVNWRSYIFDEPKLTVPKWGAGLDNSEEANTMFSNDSGEFHTWVSGFSTDGCGTRAPLDGDSAYFFLEGLPENEGAEVTLDTLKDLNVNFRLVTTAFGSGIAYGEDWKYIKGYQFGGGDCDKIGCCFKPDCASCSEYDPTKCEFTTYVPPPTSAANGLSSWLSALLVTGAFMVFGLLVTL